jgi:polyisoprenoid-binding protein YceI
MQKKHYIIAAILIVIAAGVGVYAYVVAPTKGPSQPMSPVNEVKANPEPVAEPTPVPTETPELSQGEERYTIASSESSATFELDELLRGEPVTVIGLNKGEVSGEFVVNRQNLPASKIGTIRVNARTFVTDSEQRNNAIRRMILKTEDDANEFITFKATAVTGLPTTVANDKSFEFKIVGDLTVSGTTKPATFDAMGQFKADGTFTAQATSTIKRGDFNIVVPSLPFLANIEEEVELSLQLIAKK